MATAKTVLGEVQADQLGRTLCHEHLLLTWASAKEDLPDEYNVETLADQIVNNASKNLQEYNVKTLVDVSPWQLGRDVELQQVVAQRLGINVIAATGFYRQRAGISGSWGWMTDPDPFEDLMMREITQGVGGGINGAKVKCGVIKIAWTFESPGDPEPAEEKATRAAGRASKQTGTPIVVHCSWRANPSRNLGLEQVQVLMEEGADPERIQISHCHGVRGNMGYLMDVVRTGAYVALPDSPFTTGYVGPDVQMTAGMIGGLIRAGYGDKIVFAMDHEGTWFPKTPPRQAADWPPLGSWNLVYQVYLPVLRANGVSERALEKIMVDNPARLFAW